MAAQRALRFAASASMAGDLPGGRNIEFCRAASPAKAGSDVVSDKVARPAARRGRTLVTAAVPVGGGAIVDCENVRKEGGGNATPRFVSALLHGQSQRHAQ